jgi:hypothetical protein
MEIFMIVNRNFIYSSQWNKILNLSFSNCYIELEYSVAIIEC